MIDILQLESYDLIGIDIRRAKDGTYIAIGYVKER